MIRCATYAAILLATVTPALADQVADGYRLSVEHCARCHVVEEKNRFSGISSTPSFMLLVNALDDWRERFETFFVRRPHPAVVRVEGTERLTDLPPNAAPIHLALDDVAAILAYAETLKAD